IGSSMACENEGDRKERDGLAGCSTLKLSVNIMAKLRRVKGSPARKGEIGRRCIECAAESRPAGFSVTQGIRRGGRRPEAASVPSVPFTALLRPGGGADRGLPGGGAALRTRTAP